MRGQLPVQVTLVPVNDIQYVAHILLVNDIACPAEVSSVKQGHEWHLAYPGRAVEISDPAICMPIWKVPGVVETKYVDVTSVNEVKC